MAPKKQAELGFDAGSGKEQKRAATSSPRASTRTEETLQETIMGTDANIDGEVTLESTNSNESFDLSLDNNEAAPAAVPERNDDSLPSLQDLGVIPVMDLVNSVYSMGPGEKRKFYLKAFQLEDVGEYTIGIIALPEHENHSNFVEMMLFQIVRDKSLAFVDKYNLSVRNSVGYKDGDHDFLNTRGYNVRIYTITVDRQMTRQSMHLLIASIAKQLNSYPPISTKNVVIVPDDWVLVEAPVWSNVIGYDKAAARLVRITGPAQSAEYWQNNLPRIRTHFNPRQIPYRCARMIRAPKAEIMYEPERAPMAAMEPGVGNDD